MDREKRKTYSIEEAAELLGIGRNQAYEAAKRGDIPVIRIGARRMLVPKLAFDRLLENGRAPHPASGTGS